MRPLALLPLLLLTACKSDFEKLCAFDPGGDPEKWSELERSLGSEGRGTLQALASVHPSDKGAILRSAAQEKGLASCPAADAFDRLSGLDRQTGCDDEGKLCRLDGVTPANVAALEKLDDKTGRSLSVRLTGPGQLALLAKLTWLEELWLNADEKEVNLAPLAALEKLQRLRLGAMTVSTLAPLGKLGALEALHAERVSCTGPLDLSFAAALPRLTELDLSMTGVHSDLAPLAKATQLVKLRLVGVSVPTLAPLAGLTNLEQLELPRRQAGETNMGGRRRLIQYEKTGGDISALSGLKKLTVLDAGGQGLTDASPLAGLTALEDLELSWNFELKDLSALARLPALKSVDLSHTGATDVKALSGASRLQRVNLRGTAVQTLRPLYGISGLRDVVLPEEFSEAEKAALSRNWPELQLQ